MKRKALYYISFSILIGAIAAYLIFKPNHKVTPPQKIVAVVNGEPITYHDLQREVIFSSIAGAFNSEKLKTSEKTTIEKNILEDLIIHKILLQEAREKKVSISDTEVNKYISNLVEGLSNEIKVEVAAGDTYSLSDVRNMLYSLGLTRTDKINLHKGQFFRLRNRLYFYYPTKEYPYVINFADTGIESIVRLSSAFNAVKGLELIKKPPLYEMLKKVGLTYNTWRSRIKEDLIIDKIIKEEVYNKIKISNSEVKNEYKNNKDRYYQPEKYELRQIFIARSYNNAEDLKNKKLIATIRKRLQRKRATFALLAKKYSDSPESQKGGYMGYMTLSQLPIEFSIVLPKMHKYAISKVIETPFGYHVVQILDKIPAYNKKLSEVRGEIIKKLKRDKVDKYFSDWLKKLERKSIITVYYNFFEVKNEGN